MAFVKVGSTITQTGTDTDPTGLALVSGITINTINKITFYTLATGDKMNINGTLTINPEQYCVVSGNNANAITLNGTLTLGAKNTVFGKTYYDKGVALVMRHQAASFFTASEHGLIVNGTLNLYGATIRAANSMRLSSGSTFNCEKGIFYNIHNTTNMQIRNEGSTVNILDITFDGDANEAQTFNEANIATFSSSFIRGGIQTYNADNATSLYFQNINFGQNAAEYDVVYNAGSAIRIQPVEITGLDIGSSVRVGRTSGFRGGYVGIFRNTIITVEDEDGNGVPSAYVYMVDTDNGSRFNVSGAAFRNGRSFTSDLEYTATTNGSGLTSTLQVLLKVNSADYDATASTQYNDIRGNTGVEGEDEFTFRSFTYLNKYGSVTPSLAGTGTARATIISLSDNSITQTNSATVAAYSTIDDLDELYDRAKYYKVQAANISYPTYATKPIDGNGGTLDLNVDLVLDSGAGTAFSLNTGTDTLTIKPTTDVAEGVTNTTLRTGTHTVTSTGEEIAGLIVQSGGSFITDTGGTYAGMTFRSGGTMQVSAVSTYDLTGSEFESGSTFDNATAGEVTLTLTAAQFVPTITNSGGGTVVVDNKVTISAPLLVDGTRYQFYNVTTDTEIANAVVSGGAGASAQIAYSSGQTIRFQATYQSGLTAYLPISTSGILTTNGLTFINEQNTDPIYDSIGVDGSTITELTLDASNIEIDVDDPDGIFDGRNIYAWWVYAMTTESGIRDFDPEEISANPDEYNLLFNGNLQIENVSDPVVPLRIQNVVLKNAAGTTVIEGTDIVIEPDRVYVANIEGVAGDVWAVDKSTLTTSGSIGEHVSKKISTKAVPKY